MASKVVDEQPLVIKPHHHGTVIIENTNHHIVKTLLEIIILTFTCMYLYI